MVTTTCHAYPSDRGAAHSEIEFSSVSQLQRQPSPLTVSVLILLRITRMELKLQL